MYACLICLVLYGRNKILRAITLLFCSNFFQSFDCNGNSIPFPLYWSKKKKTRYFFWMITNPIFSWFNTIASAYLKHSSSSFFGFIVALLCFIQSGESIYDPLFSYLFYEDNNAIN